MVAAAFPALSAGCTFSLAKRWLHIFPRLGLVVFFPRFVLVACPVLRLVAGLKYTCFHVTCLVLVVRLLEVGAVRTFDLSSEGKGV